MGTRCVALLAVAAGGCLFEGSDAVSGSLGETMTETATTDPTAGADTTTTDATSGGSSTSGTTGAPGSTGGDPGSTGDPTGAIDCTMTPLLKTIVAADAAMITPPMVPANGAQGPMAWSVTDDAGSVTFSFEVACEGPHTIWAMVYDLLGGPDNGALADPDSFYVQVDGGAETHWQYGCQTAPFQTWSWQRVSQQSGCTSSPLVYDLGVGTHTVRLRNDEPGNALTFSYAAVARVLITNDALYTPTSPPD